MLVGQLCLDPKEDEQSMSEGELGLFHINLECSPSHRIEPIPLYPQARDPGNHSFASI